MFEWTKYLFTPHIFEPHGTHFAQYPDLLWFTIISNLMIAAAYYSIPITLAFFVYKRRDIPFNWMFFMFSAFIFFCGTHHVVHILSFWCGLYPLEGVVDFLTGVISLITAGMLWYIFPLALKIPSIKVFQEKNTLLKEEINGRIKAEKEVRKLNKTLEKRVDEKTEEVQETALRFQTLADNIPTLTWMANADGYIFWYNSRWYEYTGTTPKDMEGWGWQSVHDATILPDVLKRWKDSIKTGEPFEMIFPLRGVDGVYRPFLTRISPVKDKKGKVLKWFGTNTDISEQVKEQQRKDEFISMASHELRTPVTSIKAYVQALRSQSEKGKDINPVPYLSRIDGQLDRLTTLIYDLLDMSRTANGQLQLHPERFNLEKLIQETIEEVKSTSNKHMIETKSLAKVWVHADRDRINQVIINLLTNAIKYSPKSDKIIVRSKLDKDKVVVSVKDFGIGINEEHKKRIFDRFFRVFGDDDKNFPGLGVGLYIASEIIKRHKGKIWVESTPGKGATFSFTLPFSKPLKNDKIKLRQ